MRAEKNTSPLPTQVSEFLAESRESQKKYPFTFKIEDYRSGVDAYIQAADRSFEAAMSSPRLTLFSKATQDLIIEDRSIDNIRLRCYQKKSAVLTPLILYFTGSAFAHSNPEWQKRNCEDLAKITGFAVLNVVERVAPEHPFSSGLRDCFSVLKWVAQHGEQWGLDKNNISLAGFSSGGNFAAVLARWARDEGIAIKHQLLISPWLDLREESFSEELFQENYGLEREPLKWFADQYAPLKEDRKNPDISPLCCDDLVGLAPATIFVGECEPFCAQAENYAESLKRAGVPVEFKILAGQIHEVGGCNRWRLAISEEDPIRLGAENIKRAVDSSHQHREDQEEISVATL